MARRVKNAKDTDAVLTIQGDVMGSYNTSERTQICVIGKGKTKYLWVGIDGSFAAAFSGNRILRAFARQILKGL